MRQKASLQSSNRRRPSARVTPKADCANKVRYHSDASKPADGATLAMATDRSRADIDPAYELRSRLACATDGVVVDGPTGAPWGNTPHLPVLQGSIRPRRIA